MRFYLYLILFILGINAGFGAEKKAHAAKHEKAVLKVDSASAVDVRHFDQSVLNTYRKKPEFQYKEATADISGWTRFWRWFWHWLDSLFSSKPAKGLPTFWDIFWRIFKILLLALGVGALIFFIFKAQGINILGIFRKKATGAPIPYSEFFEDINTINFDGEIEGAIAKGNYRFAVRLLYLKCLKHLTDAGLIDWQIDKTNGVYISELKNQQQQEAFRMLTLQFEYVWYGELLIDQQAFKTIDSSFKDFNKQVA
ncbi:MAG: DUF4129 domain-containing protein [Mucilaginibacter sp.]|nr:DUF4129 domain-containing protein [Mucilaginibacter sp.]